MTTIFDKRDFSEFPPQSRRWSFATNGTSSSAISLSDAIGLARSVMHQDGHSLTQQDSALAIAVKECMFKGIFRAGKTANGSYCEIWQIKYQMPITEVMYPPCTYWRTKYGKLGTSRITTVILFVPNDK
ncbi:MAG: hypothetical protein V7K67_02205 [Nostoc sp.]|uniref:hypothetical protein n=1 Tax=Nostoc sp. TaxID=1180 RepID=UPI002FF51A00